MNKRLKEALIGAFAGHCLRGGGIFALVLSASPTFCVLALVQPVNGLAVWAPGRQPVGAKLCCVEHY